MFYVGIHKKGQEIIARFPYKIGIVTFMAVPALGTDPTNVVEKIRFLAEDPFFELLELPVISNDEWNRLKSFVDSIDRSIDFALALQPLVLRGNDPAALDEDKRREVEKLFIEHTDAVGRRGYGAVALCSGPRTLDVEKAVNAFVKTVSSIAETAKRYNMNVYIETFDEVWDRKRLLGRLEFSAKVVENIRTSYPNVYLLWDLSHGPLLNEKPEDLKSYMDLIGHIHIGCAKRVGDSMYDSHPGFYRPGAINDEKDVVKLLEVLIESRYRGAISFEVKPEENQTPQEVVSTAKSVLVRAYQIYLANLIKL